MSALLTRLVVGGLVSGAAIGIVKGIRSKNQAAPSYATDQDGDDYIVRPEHAAGGPQTDIYDNWDGTFLGIFRSFKDDVGGAWKELVEEMRDIFKKD
jgi:hypothetical protein